MSAACEGLTAAVSPRTGKPLVLMPSFFITGTGVAGAPTADVCGDSSDAEEDDHGDGDGDGDGENHENRRRKKHPIEDVLGPASAMQLHLGRVNDALRALRTQSADSTWQAKGRNQSASGIRSLSKHELRRAIRDILH